MGRPRYNEKAQCAKGGAITLLVAVVTVSIASRSVSSFALWYIATRTTLIVIVMNLLFGWFLSFVHRVVRTDFRHCFSLLRRLVKLLGLGPVIYLTQSFQQPRQCGPPPHVSPQLVRLQPYRPQPWQHLVLSCGMSPKVNISTMLKAAIESVFFMISSFPGKAGIVPPGRRKIL